MFGFLRLRRRGLAQDDRALYNAHFCAACHGMAEFGGRLSSFLTNYDQTFLQLIFSSLDPAGARPAERRACVAVPLRRVQVQPVSAAARPVLAALNIALIEAKLRDDVVDEGKVAARVGLRVMAGRAERAHRLLETRGFPLESIRELGERQRLAETAERPCLGSLSTPTAQALTEIFGFVARLTEQPAHEEALREIGDSLGRFIYVFDALEDLDEDTRKSRFNAIRAAFGERWSRTRVRGFLLDQMRRLERSLDTLPLSSRKKLADQLLRSLRRRLDERVPGEALSLERLLSSSAPRHGWLHGLRHRAQAQRGDCDCNCDGCDGCSACCDCSSCACDGANCCATGGCTFAQFMIVLAIVVVIIIIIAVLSSRHSSPPPVAPPSPTPTITRSVSPAPAPTTSAAPSTSPRK